MATDLRIWVRNADYEILDELDTWVSLVAVKRWNRPGSWTLELPADSRFVDYFLARGGIVVKVGGVTVFSGSATVSIERTSDRATIAGTDDNALLEEPARPTPSLSEPDPMSGTYPDAYDVRTGVASSIMSAYVGVNIGAAAPVGTRIDALFLTSDPLAGPTLTGRANLQSLRALLAGLADAAGGLAFEIMQSDVTTGRLDFRIWEPIDRTADAKFSVDLDTISDYRDTLTFDDVNYWVVLGGDGFGERRSVREGGDAVALASAGRRITGVYDARGITDTGELEQKLAELLAGAVHTRQTTVQPIDVPGVEYYVYWDRGDTVSVTVAGETRTGVIREVTIAHTPDDGLTITPTIGDLASDTDDDVTRVMRSQNERLSNIERNYGVPDSSIIPPMLDTIDVPAANEVLTYDAPQQRLKWFTLNELIGVTTIPSLTVTGNIVAGGTVQGTRLISTVAIGTAPLTVTSTTVVPNLNASLLSGVAEAALAKLAAAAFVGVVSVGGNFSVSTNALNVDAAGNKVRINSASVTGWDLTVGTGGILAEGSSRIQGQLVISTGGISVTGASLFSTTVTISAGGVDVSGSSTFRASVTVTTGGANITGTVAVTGAFSASLASSFGAGLSIAGGLAVTTGAVTLPNTTFGAFGVSAVSRQSIGGAATDLASVITLANNLRSAHNNLGWTQT